MTKPDDIPQDVWNFCINWGAEIGLEERQYMSAALAITAEREACAAVIERGDDHWIAYRAALAKRIRSRGAA